MNYKLIFFLIFLPLLVSCRDDEPQSLEDLFNNHTWTCTVVSNDPDAPDQIRIFFGSNHQYTLRSVRNGKEYVDYSFKDGSYTLNLEKYRVTCHNSNGNQVFTIELTTPTKNNPLGYCLRGYRNRVFLP